MLFRVLNWCMLLADHSTWSRACSTWSRTTSIYPGCWSACSTWSRSFSEESDRTHPEIPPWNPRWTCGAHLKEISTKNLAAIPLKVDYPKQKLQFQISNTSKKFQDQPTVTPEPTCSPPNNRPPQPKQTHVIYSKFISSIFQQNNNRWSEQTNDPQIFLTMYQIKLKL